VDALREAFQTQERGVDVRSGVAGALAVVAPLVLGLAFDEQIAGVIPSIGAMPRGRTWFAVSTTTRSSGTSSG